MYILTIFITDCTFMCSHDAVTSHTGSAHQAQNAEIEANDIRGNIVRKQTVHQHICARFIEIHKLIYSIVR